MPEAGQEFELLAERVGHAFNDPELLQLALSHRSWCAEHSDAASNERLEFLGDAILGLIVCNRIFEQYPALEEGEMTKIKL